MTTFTATPTVDRPTATPVADHHYTLELIRDEARQLVERGALDRGQPICALCNYIAAREWPSIEAELEENDYCLRDRIGDLLPHETWSND